MQLWVKTCNCWVKLDGRVSGMNGIRRDELDRKVLGLLIRGGIAAVMNMRQTYTVKHIRKGLTLLS